MRRASDKFLPGALDLPISKSLRQTFNGVLQVGEGSLDLAPRRLLLNGQISAQGAFPVA